MDTSFSEGYIFPFKVTLFSHSSIIDSWGTNNNKPSYNRNADDNNENFKDRNAVKCPNKYIFQSCTDKTQPFGYQNSDLKNLYISKKALESRLVAPIMTQSQMLSLPNFN